MIDLSRLMLVVLITAELTSSLLDFSWLLQLSPKQHSRSYDQYGSVGAIWLSILQLGRQSVGRQGWNYLYSWKVRCKILLDHARIPFWEGCKTKQKSFSLTDSKPWASKIPVGHLNLLSLEEPLGNWVHLACTLCTTRINSVECMRVCVCVGGGGGRGEWVGIKGKGGGLGRKETVAPFRFSLLYSPLSLSPGLPWHRLWKTIH